MRHERGSGACFVKRPGMRPVAGRPLRDFWRHGANAIEPSVTKADVGEALLRAAVAVMRPLVRRMLARGVTFGLVEARLRELFVEVAEQDFALPGRTQTDSRIALLTGINRKEVRRIRQADSSETAPQSFQRNIAASLVSRWRSHRKATDDKGRPIAIPYQAERGISFVALAKETTVDLPPRALLDALIGAGAAELRADKKVVLRRAAYVPERGSGEMLAMLADDPAELLDTMLHNVVDGEAEEGVFLQQKLAFDGIGSDGLPELRAALRREGERLMQRANAVLVRHDRDRNPRAPGGVRNYAGIGVYYFETPLEGPDEDEGEKLDRPVKSRKGKRKESPK